MGFRFGKSIKICKGVRLNVSTKGIGVSAGVKGARISVGPRGVRGTASLPGTGISYSEYLSSGSSKRNYSNNSSHQEWINNDYLGKEKLIKANSKWELELKKEAELEKWKKQEEREKLKERINDLKEKALEMTEEAIEKNEGLKNILDYTLDIDDKLDWNTQKDFSEFKEFVYEEKEPSLSEVFKEFRVPRKSFLEIFFKGIKAKRENLENDAHLVFNEKTKNYLKNKELKFKEYLIEKEKFYKIQNNKNKEIDNWKENFEKNETESVEKYIEVILGNSVYPESINIEYEVDCINEEDVLISLKLPSPEEIPNEIEHKYSPTKKEIVAKTLNKTETSLLYDNVIFQITLRTIHEIFEAVYTNSINKIILNGWVESIDKTTGTNAITCIISVDVTNEIFEKIDLSRIEFKACLDSLGAKYKKNLIKLEPIEPIFDIDKDNEYFEVEEEEEVS